LICVRKNWLLNFGIMTKEKVIEALEKMPQEFSTEELIERLIFIDKIEKGLQDLRDGKTMTLEEAKERARQWLK